MSTVIEQVVGSIKQANELLELYEARVNAIEADQKQAAEKLDEIVELMSQQKVGNKHVVPEEKREDIRNAMNSHDGLADLFSQYVKLSQQNLLPAAEKTASDLGKPALDRPAGAQSVFDASNVRRFADLPGTRAIQF